jgi:hypothetical protein
MNPFSNSSFFLLRKPTLVVLSYIGHIFEQIKGQERPTWALLFILKAQIHHRSSPSQILHLPTNRPTNRPTNQPTNRPALNRTTN